MKMLRWSVVVISLLVSSVASANQVQETPPPPPPPATGTPEAPPTYQTTPTPAPAPTPTPAPAPAPANTTSVSTGGQWQSSTTSVGGEAGVETHDGFFLRLGLGFGWGWWGDDAEVDSVEATGFAVGLEIAVGAVLTDNLAAHVSLFGTGIADPKVTVDGEDRGTREGATLTGTGFGVGLTYFIMPANLYLSGAIGLGAARLTFNSGTADETSIDTDTGYALELLVGKEWWVSPQWGMGLALQLVHLNVPDGDRHLLGTGVQVLFSATCN